MSTKTKTLTPKSSAKFELFVQFLLNLISFIRGGEKISLPKFCHFGAFRGDIILQGCLPPSGFVVVCCFKSKELATVEKRQAQGS